MMRQMRQMTMTLAVIVGCLLFNGVADANTITSLYNTGVDATGTPLPDGTVGDPHYGLIAVPGGTSDIRIRTSLGGAPIPPYSGDDPYSAWIGPNNNQFLGGYQGLYGYQTFFDLTGFDLSSVVISGGWQTDNAGFDIFLDGNPLGFTTASDQYELGFSPFSVSSGFKDGLNDLVFVINNDDFGSPTALRVEMTGTGARKTVPEPSALLLLAGGLTCVLGFRRLHNS